MDHREVLEHTRTLLKSGSAEACVHQVREALAADGPNPYARHFHVLLVRALLGLKGREQEALNAADAGLQVLQTDQDLLGLKALLLVRLGRAADAVRAYRRLYGLGQQAAVGNLFAVLVDRGRLRMARRLEAEARAAGADNQQARYALATLALYDHDAPKADSDLDAAEASRAGGPRLARLRSVSSSLSCELAAGDSMAGVRHLGIAGVSYVGSTIFGVILGSMPDWAFAGETHWLTNARVNGARQSILDHPDVSVWPTACRVCGRDCQAFTPDFRLGLAHGQTGWYAQIARRLGVSNIISSEKNFPNFWERDPLLRLDAVVLYKSPPHQVRSELKQALRKGGPEAEDSFTESLSQTLDRWAEGYLQHLELLRARSKVFLNWDRFVEAPGAHLQRLGEALDLPVSANLLREIRLGHFIGGNTGVDVARIRATGAVELRSSDAPELPVRMSDAVSRHRYSGSVFRRLENQYAQVFGRPQEPEAQPSP